MRDDALEAPIFVVGPSRSGTALLRSILNQHAGIHIAGETHYFDDLRRRLGAGAGTRLVGDEQRRTEDYFLALAHRPYGHGGIADESPLDRGVLREEAARLGGHGDAYFEAFCRLNAQLEGREDVPRRWGEKTPRHAMRLSELLTRYPTGQAIVMVRDPRAVVASYRDWHGNGSSAALQDDSRSREADRTRTSYDPSVISLLWRATVAAARKARDRYGTERVRLQRYEDLVENPHGEAPQLARWLGVPYAAEMLDVPLHNSSIHGFTDSAGISREPLERWRARLGTSEVAVVQRWCSRPMSQLGYALDPVALSPSEHVRILGRVGYASWRALVANRDRAGSVPGYVARRARYLVGS